MQLNKSGKVQKCKKSRNNGVDCYGFIISSTKAHILLHSGASFGQGPDVPLPRYHRIE